MERLDSWVKSGFSFQSTVVLDSLMLLCADLRPGTYWLFHSRSCSSFLFAFFPQTNTVGFNHVLRNTDVDHIYHIWMTAESYNYGRSRPTPIVSVSSYGKSLSVVGVCARQFACICVCVESQSSPPPAPFPPAPLPLPPHLSRLESQGWFHFAISSHSFVHRPVAFSVLSFFC